eukprot:11164601-Lingulodinium_polyedra.AAC.1
MAMRCLFPANGINNYAMDEIYSFVLDCGRLNGILHTYQENAVIPLLRGVAIKLNMRTRMSP